MRIVHISDLHFGKHNNTLASNLKNRLAKVKPDVIVCTGDLADDTKEKLLSEAYAYLEELQRACAIPSDENGPDQDRPKVLVIPGNHDYHKNGFLWSDRDRQYMKVFGSSATDHWYEPENVWIYGFDSASEGSVGGSGLVTAEDLERFHQRCENLESQNPAFKDAFRIVAVHHHPLPVSWDSEWRDRFLTMTNAGAFLSAILLRRVDLVLHGHEHLQGRARLWSTLGGNDHETTIVSLGATLRQMDKGKENWFGVIDITPTSATIDFYSSLGSAFSEQPDGPTFAVRSRAQSADLEFERLVRHAGFSYRDLSSLTVIGIDGDARRTLQLNGLTINNETCPRREAHSLELPLTSGYLDCLYTTNASVTPRIAPGDRSNHYSGTVAFDPALAVGEPHDYAITWWAVNAFALDTQQFDYLHSAQPQHLDDREYTHITVTDPVEELTVVVKFPEGFTPVENPRVHVVTPLGGSDSRTWKTEAGAVNRLNREHALRYYPELSVAALRVRRPVTGLSYGIEWKLPKPVAPVQDQYSLDVDELRSIWLEQAEKPGPGDAAQKEAARQKQEVSRVLARLTIGARKAFLSGWDGPLEASFMYFDGRAKLRLLGAVLDYGGEAVEQEYSFELPYGDGIAGRAFKTKEPRVYAEDKDDQRPEPDYYTRMPNTPAHKCLLSIPIAPPPDGGANGNIRDPYGVFTLGSIRRNCPIALMAGSSGPSYREELKVFQENANVELYNSFRDIFFKQRMA